MSEKENIIEGATSVVGKSLIQEAIEKHRSELGEAQQNMNTLRQQHQQFEEAIAQNRQQQANLGVEIERISARVGALESLVPGI